MSRDWKLAELAEESQTPGNVGPGHVSRQGAQAGGISEDYNVLFPRGRGGITVSTGNGGSANGGSVIITGGNITNSAGSANGGNGGNASSGSVTIGGAGGPEDSAPPPEPAPSPGRTPPASSEASSPPEAPTARPPPSSPPVSPTAHPQNSTTTPISSGTATFSETIQSSGQTAGVSSVSEVSTLSQTHHTTASMAPATAQQGGAARHVGPGPSRSLLLKVLLPVFAVLLLGALASALVLRRRRRWRRLAETPTAYVFPRESVVSDNSSRNSSKQRLLDAMAGKPGSSQPTMHEPEISRASSSASGATNTAALLDAMRHAGLPVSVVAVLQNAPQDQDSEVPPSYHRGQVDLEASTSAMGRGL